VALDAMEEHAKNDTAIKEALAVAQNFFFYGIQPNKGLDKLDQVRPRVDAK